MSDYGTRGNGRSIPGTPRPRRARAPKPPKMRTPPTGQAANGRYGRPGGPKGLPPGLGGAARSGGVGAPGQTKTPGADGAPNQMSVVANLRSRFGRSKKPPGA